MRSAVQTRWAEKLGRGGTVVTTVYTYCFKRGGECKPREREISTNMSSSPESKCVGARSLSCAMTSMQLFKPVITQFHSKIIRVIDCGRAATLPYTTLLKCR